MTAGNRKHPARRHPGPARPDGGPLAWLMLLAICVLLAGVLGWLAWTALPDVVRAFWPVYVGLGTTAVIGAGEYLAP